MVIAILQLTLSRETYISNQLYLLVMKLLVDVQKRGTSVKSASQRIKTYSYFLSCIVGESSVISGGYYVFRSEQLRWFLIS